MEGAVRGNEIRAAQVMDLINASPSQVMYELRAVSEALKSDRSITLSQESLRDIRQAALKRAVQFLGSGSPAANHDLARLAAAAHCRIQGVPEDIHTPELCPRVPGLGERAQGLLRDVLEARAFQKSPRALLPVSVWSGLESSEIRIVQEFVLSCSNAPMFVASQFAFLELAVALEQAATAAK